MAGTATALDGTTFNSVAVEGGNGNDTITLQGAAYFSAVNLNANKGNDVVDIRSATLNETLIGLGAGNDNYSGVATGASDSTIAGGKGNDIISLSLGAANTFSGNIIVVTVATMSSLMVMATTPSIFPTAGGTLASGTVFGGGGNDSISSLVLAPTMLCLSP